MSKELGVDSSLGEWFKYAMLGILLLIWALVLLGMGLGIY